MPDVEVRESGLSITVSEGDRLIVRVSENSTTGYQWSPGTITDALELESSEFTPPRDPRPGAGGERVIVLRATHAGRGTAEFTLTRPWEDKEPLQRWRVDVTVT